MRKRKRKIRSMLQDEPKEEVEGAHVHSPESLVAKAKAMGMDFAEVNMAEIPRGVREMIRNQEMAWPIEIAGTGDCEAMSFEKCAAKQRSKSLYFVLPKEATERLKGLTWKSGTKCYDTRITNRARKEHQ